jgi:FtsZ-binding cell division protein ZapB
MLFFLHKIKLYEVFETILDKLEEKIKQAIDKGKLDRRPFAFEYYTVLLWQTKSMDRQAKEKLHLLSVELQKLKDQGFPSKDAIE